MMPERVEKSILTISLILLIFASFVRYAPKSLSVTRRVLLVFNKSSTVKTGFINIVYYSKAYGKAIDADDCNKAVESAENAYRAWRELMRTDSITTIPGYSIELTYKYLYRAYKCKGFSEFSKGNIQSATECYRASDYYLSYITDKEWAQGKIWSVNCLATCYNELGEYTIADSLTAIALKKYAAIEQDGDIDSISLSSLMTNAGRALSRQGLYDKSNALHTFSNYLIRKTDTTNKSDLLLLDNFNAIVKNYIALDSIQQAIATLAKAREMSIRRKSGNCENLLYTGICYYKLNKYKKADSFIRSALNCYKYGGEEDILNVAETEYTLSFVNIALGKYDTAKYYITDAISIINKQPKVSSRKHISYITILAGINKLRGDYLEADRQYTEALTAYNQTNSGVTYQLPNLLSGIADLDVTLDRPTLAKRHADSSLIAASFTTGLKSPSATYLLNTAAYVDYSIGKILPADAQYRNVMEINHKHGKDNEATSAIASNGYALVKTARKEYKLADSFFQHSLNLHKALFGENHPLTAQVYLNHAIMCLTNGQITAAEQKINSALAINTLLLSSDHDFFGDVYMIQGDIAKKKGQTSTAQELYHKALQIYLKKFDKKHWKVLSVTRKM